MTNHSINDEANNKTIYMKDYKASNYEIDNINLNIVIDEIKKIVVVTSCIKFINKHRDKNNLLVLDGESDLQEICLNNQPLIRMQDFYIENHKLHFNIDLYEYETFELKIITHVNPYTNKTGDGLYEASNDLLLTQCEPQGFRKITYYLDRPDILATFKTTITANYDVYPTLLSNGNKTFEKIDGQLKTVTWEDNFKKPSYLFALVAGKLDVYRDTFITKSGRNIALEIYTETQYIKDTKYAMTSLIKSLKWEEEYFNLEYDLDTYMIVATHNFNMGAMENKGLNIFNAKYILANSKIASDDDFLNIEAVIAHEYFHNWTGNRVTCRDWFQLSLKEGLTVFRDQQFTASMHDATVKRIQDVEYLKTHQFAEDKGPLAHPVRPSEYIEINNFYTVTVYEKGAELVRMYFTLFGETGFKKGLDLYLKSFDGMAATCNDFCNLMFRANSIVVQENTQETMQNNTSHNNLQQYYDNNQMTNMEQIINQKQFMLWYSQDGTPLVKINTFYDNKNHTYTIICHQSIADSFKQKNKKAMLIPLKFALFDYATGHKIYNFHIISGKYIVDDKKELILILDANHNEFKIVNVNANPILSVLRDFSAPIELEYSMTDQEKLFLIKNDDNLFNRYTQLQQLYVKYIKSIYNSLLAIDNQNKINIKNINYLELISQLNLENIVHNDFLVTILHTIQNINLSSEYRSYMLKLPNCNELLVSMQNVIPEILMGAINVLELFIANQLFDSLLEIYNINLAQTYIYEDHGKRSLKNIALSYISNSLGHKIILQTQNNDKYLNSTINILETICLGQMNNADNMTDKLAVLIAINNFDLPIRDTIFTQFYNTWHNNELIMDKWFALLASSFLISTDMLSKLMVNKSFNATNPNKIYALLKTFTNNPICFHNAEAYNFIAEQVILIDKFNSNVASRLASGFSKINQLNNKYRILLKPFIKKILDHKPSNDVFEITNKIYNNLN